MKETTLTFSTLYKKYADHVFRFSYWLCGDEAEAKWKFPKQKVPLPIT